MAEQLDAIQIDQEQFISTSDFDDYSRVTKAVYPNSFAVQNAYDSNGFFIGMSNSASGQPYWTAKDIDALGRVTEERFGNGVTTVKKYDPTDERLRHIDASGNGERVLDLDLDYDLIGNLKTRLEKLERKKLLATMRLIG
jgi:hypothetical protein